MDNRVEACPLASDWGLLWQAYMDSKLLPLPGGRRRTGDYDSGVCRVVQPPGMLPLPGALCLLWSSTERLIPMEAIGAALCLVLLHSHTSALHPGVQDDSNTLHSCHCSVSLSLTRAQLCPCHSLVPMSHCWCTTAWLSRCCALVTLLKFCLRKIKSENNSERLCNICDELVAGAFFKSIW